MKLKTKLSQLNKDDYIYLGAKCAFFWMGTVEELNNELDDLNKLWLKKFTQRNKNANNKVAFLRKNEPKVGDTQTKKVWENGRHIEKTYNYEELIRQWIGELNAANDNVKTTEKHLREFKPFEDRTIKETYPNIDRNATIIIINGYEAGEFWLKSEWERYQRGEQIFIIGEDEQ